MSVSAAMEILLNLPPVHIVVQAKAFATADRLVQNGMWSPNFERSHGKIRKKIENEVFEMPRDRLRPETGFTKLFETTLVSRAEWQDGWPARLAWGDHVCFTDGSKMSESSGAGIHMPDLGIDESFYLGSLTSIFQAEVFATLIGGLNMIPTEISGKKIYICSDSEASIKALSSPTVTSKMVKECKETLNRVGLRNHITLIWVPGHSGIEGNERADELARLGSSSRVFGPESFVPVPQSVCNAAIESWIQSQHVQSWQSYPGGVHTKHFFQGPNKK